MNLTIRPAVPADAEAMLAYAAAVFEEADNNLLYEPGEFAFTVEQEREFIAHGTGVILLALHAEQLVGIGDLGLGTHRAKRHVASLGLSVHPEWRRQGVGTRLMTALLAWADARPELQRVELEVYARNAGAITLYERCGFVQEGVRRAAVCKGGQLLDVVVMGRMASGAYSP